MGKRNLYVTDFDYLFVESDLKDTVRMLGDVANEFCTILHDLGEGLEGQIAEELKKVHNHMGAISQASTYLHKKINKKMQTYIVDIDKIDDFMY